jgi:hypothetical protein
MVNWRVVVRCLSVFLVSAIVASAQDEQLDLEICCEITLLTYLPSPTSLHFEQHRPA